MRFTRVHGDGLQLMCVEIAGGDRWRPSPIAALSPRKRAVAQFVALGSSNKEIAESMEISVDTVRSHLRAIFEDLAVSSRVELANVVQCALEP